MKIFKCSKIGEYHINHNEDDIIETQIGEDKIVFAIMDGCSMGKESHFASTLVKKLIRKISNELHFKEFAEKKSYRISDVQILLLEKIFNDLKLIKGILNLNQDEILTTLMLGIINKETQDGELIIIGDGIVNFNGNIFEFDQKNKPDYIGYHINEDFENWLNSQSQKLSLENIKDLSISSDGIFSFKKYHIGNFESIEEKGVIDFLLNDNSQLDSPKMLNNKLDQIEKIYGLRNYDDISIIRIIFN